MDVTILCRVPTLAAVWESTTIICATPPGPVGTTAFTAILWNIWKHRNCKVFRDETSTSSPFFGVLHWTSCYGFITPKTR